MLESAQLALSAVTNVFDASTDCVKLIDGEGRLLWMNQGGLCTMEIDDFALFEGGAWCDFWPEDSVDLVRKAVSADPPVSSHFTALCPTARGTPKYWEVSVVPVEDTFGQHFGYIATSRDVTEREMAARNREILIREMRHRQNNTLTLAASLCSLHAGKDPALRDFATDMGVRFSALARAQAVVSAKDVSVPRDHDALAMLDTLVSPCAGPDCDISFDVTEDLRIPSRGIDPLGVILAELAVNSMKHGAFRHGGTVEIIAQPSDDDIEITWHERSKRSVRATTREGGQGLDLMRRIAAVNNAEFIVDWHDHGYVARLLLRR